MTPIIYEELTQEQLNFIVSGCGPKVISWMVPECGFTPACNRHDVSYWRGGTNDDRLLADKVFLKDMLDIARQQSWWRRWAALSCARIYYYAVRTFGRASFRIGDERTMEDLHAAMLEV